MAPPAVAHVAPFGGRDRVFKLRLGECAELEISRRCGLAAIYHRLATLQWFVDDIRETVRLGLVGGGTLPAEADFLIARHVDADDAPRGQWLQLAVDILTVAIDGMPKPLPGKTTGEGESAPPATSPPSTRPEE